MCCQSHRYSSTENDRIRGGDDDDDSRPVVCVQLAKSGAQSWGQIMVGSSVASSASSCVIYRHKEDEAAEGHRFNEN